MTFRIFVVTACLLAGAVSAAAQDRLFALLASNDFRRQTLIEVDTRVPTFGQIRKVFRLATNGFDAPPVAIGGGRYLVWLDRSLTEINLFDTRAGTAITLPGVVTDPTAVVAVDAPGLRLFTYHAGVITVIDGRNGTVRTIGGLSSNSIFFPVAAYAPGTDRLFVRGVPQGTGPWQIDVINVGAGVVEKTLTLPTVVSSLGVDRAGTRLFVGTSGVTAEENGFRVLDPQNGMLLAQHARWPASTSVFRSPFVFDESRGRVLVVTGDPPVGPPANPGLRLSAFSLDTFAHLGTIDGGPSVWNDSGPFQVLAGPRSPVYVFNALSVTQDGCDRAELSAIDPDSGVTRQRVDVTQIWGAATGQAVCRAHLTLLSPPPAPLVSNPVVIGSQVTLTWTPSYDAAHYDLEAGSAPGLSNVLVSLGNTATSLTVDGVPPGRYFVRVRAVNAVGRSLPSADIEVVVP